MISPAVDLRLQGSARSELRLRSGDFVSVEVIKRLTGDKWAVAIRGRVLPARAHEYLQLSAGQRLTAQVSLQGRQIHLRLLQPDPSSGRELLLRAGLPADAASEAIASALLRSGLSATPQNLGRVREILERLRLDPRRFARLAALLLSKGIELRSGGVAELLPVLGHGYGDGREEGRRYRGRQGKGDAQGFAASLRAVVEGQAGDAECGVQVFNHLRGRGGSWVIVPYSLAVEPGERIDGTLRLLYDEARGSTTRYVLTARVERDGRSSALWSFRILRREGQTQLECYCDDEGEIRAARRHLTALRRKLGNLGVKADDTIRKDDTFDGFSPAGEDVHYRAVDTVG